MITELTTYTYLFMSLYIDVIFLHTACSFNNKHLSKYMLLLGTIVASLTTESFPGP